MPRQPRVSMAIVAARAGVSGQTVSRVANDSPNVDPATRARVEKAMAELGYRPNRAARALRTGRSRTIGLVATTLATVGNSRMLQGVAETAATRGYALTVITADDAADDAVDHAFQSLHDQGVDGAIVLNEASALAAGVRPPSGLHLVVIDAPSGSGLASVQSDHAGGAAAATTHLLDLGHAQVHHLAGPADSFAATERERGWRMALESRGIEPPGIVRGDWSAEAGHTAGASFAAATAVFCANDQMALGLIRALADAGRRVPHDVSVVGFDDVPEAANYRPPLTTVRQDFSALAERAVQALIADIEGDTGPQASLISTVLIERHSTAAG